MTKLTSVEHRKVQHLCIFGDPKSGKSELAATTAAFFRRVIWVSMDNGYEILFKLPKEHQEKIELVRLPDTKEFPVAIDTCLKLVSGKDCKICDLHGQVDCRNCRAIPTASWTSVNLSGLATDEVVVFDHISQAADSAMSLVTKGKPVEYKPEWHDYAYQGALMNKFLMNIQQAPYNCICIAHTCETEMDDGTKKLVPLVGTVPFSRVVGKYFDHIIYCRVSNKKHNFGSATTYIASVLTGSRSDVALETQKVDRPTLQPFFEGKMEHLRVGEEAPKSVIQKLREEMAEKVEEKVEDASPATTVVEEGEEVEEKQEATKEEVKEELGETVQAVLDKVNTPEVAQALEPEPEPEMSSAEKAKERLRKLREGRI